MKFNQQPSGKKFEVYCIHCQAFLGSKSASRYDCRSCGESAHRALIVDPEVLWYTANNGEYCHETAGVFVANEAGEFLFFDRNKFPFGLTVPAGHLAPNEPAELAANRELFEETGLRPNNLRSVFVETIVGDQCRRGADIHKWHGFAAKVRSGTIVQVDESEGSQPVWLTLEEALASELTFATRHIILNHFDALTASAA